MFVAAAVAGERPRRGEVAVAVARSTCLTPGAFLLAGARGRPAATIRGRPAESVATHPGARVRPC
jgi:hypothetical protein